MKKRQRRQKLRNARLALLLDSLEEANLADMEGMALAMLYRLNRIRLAERAQSHEHWIGRVWEREPARPVVVG